MENQYSKITEVYKAEVIDILSRISESLSEKVSNNLDAQITNLIQQVGEHNNFTQNIVNENRDTNLITSEQIEIIISNFERYNALAESLLLESKNNKLTISSYLENIINSIKSSYSNLSSEKTKQIEIINSLQSVLIKKIEDKANLTKENLLDIKKSIVDSNIKIEEQNLSLTNLIILNNNFIEKTGKILEEYLGNELSNLSNKLNKIESDNKLLLLIKEVKMKQEKTALIILILLFLIVFIFAFSIFIILYK